MERRVLRRSATASNFWRGVQRSAALLVLTTTFSGASEPAYSRAPVALASATVSVAEPVQGDPHRDQRDLVLLVTVDHAQIPAAGQVRATPAPALRKPVQLLVRHRAPGQIGPRRLRLLTPRPLQAATSLRCGRRATRIIVTQRRHRRGRRGRRVTRQQMLQPGQPAHQLRDPRILLGNPSALLPRQRDQLFTRQILQRRHTKIKPHRTEGL